MIVIIASDDPETCEIIAGLPLITLDALQADYPPGSTAAATKAVMLVLGRIKGADRNVQLLLTDESTGSALALIAKKATKAKGGKVLHYQPKKRRSVQ